MSDPGLGPDQPAVTVLNHPLGWSRLRRAVVGLAVVLMAAWLTDRGLVRWIGWTAEIASQVDHVMADLRLRVADPPQLELEGALSQLVVAWDPTDPACTRQLAATLRWIEELPESRRGEVGLLLLPTAEDAPGNPLATALAAVHSHEKLMPWLRNWAEDRPVTVATLRGLAVGDDREAAIFARQLDNTELQLTARIWTRMAQGLDLGSCGARVDGWQVASSSVGDWRAALAKQLAKLVAFREGATLDPALSQQAGVRAAGLTAPAEERWQRWIIEHQRVSNAANSQEKERQPSP